MSEPLFGVIKAGDISYDMYYTLLGGLPGGGCATVRRSRGEAAACGVGDAHDQGAEGGPGGTSISLIFLALIPF